MCWSRIVWFINLVLRGLSEGYARRLSCGRVKCFVNHACILIGDIVRL